ncbi:MAG: hypothetical protein RSE33_20810, partial [Hafnia sp.]
IGVRSCSLSVSSLAQQILEIAVKTIFEIFSFMNHGIISGSTLFNPRQYLPTASCVFFNHAVSSVQNA